jgi:AraC-like DNA-binding protein
MDSISTKKRDGFLGQKLIFIPENIRNNIKDNPLINSLYITSIGYFPHAVHHFRERKEGANQFILIYCTEGSGTIEIDTNDFRLTPNHFVIIPAHTSHRYKADEDNPWSIYWVHFAGSRARILYDRYLHNNDSKIGQIPFQKQRISFFDHIMRVLERGYSNDNMEYINVTLWELMSSFIYADFFQEIGHQSTKPDFISKAISYMQQSLNQSISVEEIARHVNYSVSYFHSVFKEKTGFSPIHYFNHLKIQRACQYLSFTDLNINEISYKLGFDDPFYFSRLFKKMMNLSPSEYRQLYKTKMNS